MLEVNSGLIVWTIITFVILLILLRKFAWRPLLDSLERREEHIRTSVERAEQARAESEKLIEEHRRRLEGAEQEGHRILAESRVLADKLKAEIVAQANQQSRNMISHAHQEIERAKEAALTALRGEVAHLAIRVAEKILDETIDEKRHRKLIDGSLDKLPVN